jgi:PAS domain S-box-containing protein
MRNDAAGGDKVLVRGFKETCKARVSFEALLKTAMDAFWVANAESGRFLAVNDAACRLTEYTRAELLSMTMGEMGVADSMEQTGRLYRRVIDRGRLRFDTKLRCKDGRVVEVELSANFADQGDGLLFVFARDITSRKEGERQRRNLHRQVRAKNTELEQIIYVTSHDLRSPLVNIRGFAGELRRSIEEVSEMLSATELDEEIRRRLDYLLGTDIPESLQYIAGSAEKMDTLLRGLLKLSRLGRMALTIESLDMTSLVKSCARSCEYALKQQGGAIEVAVLPGCRGDAAQVEQVFTNLIENAIKYTPAGTPPIVRVSGERHTDVVVYCVEDEGIGIAPAYHEKVFEMFHRLEPDETPGDGLGLAIVRRCLDRMQGRVWLDSEPAKGSRVYVSLPAARRETDGTSSGKGYPHETGNGDRDSRRR